MNVKNNVGVFFCFAAESLRLDIFLGGSKKPGGWGGGRLTIHEDEPNQTLSTPAALKYSNNVRVARVMYLSAWHGDYVPFTSQYLVRQTLDENNQPQFEIDKRKGFRFYVQLRSGRCQPGSDLILVIND